MLERAKYYRTHPHSQRDQMLAHGEDMAKKLDSIPLGKTFANLGMSIGKAFGVLDMMGLAGKRDMPAYAPKYFMQSARLPAKAAVTGAMPGYLYSHRSAAAHSLLL